MNNELTAALLTIEKCRELSGCPAGVDLQDWVKQLAAENVGLKEDRDTLARYWIEDGGDKDCAMSYCEPTPATDRIVAEAEASGVEKFADEVEREADGYGMDSHDWRRMMKVRADAIEFAKQLREGVDK
ncbi:hypothetical protein FML35_19085 [Klebsiella oxytoca]|uniref:Uncharacterized protein n=1 Tax=Klebsiella oxytoca TaxID=571 RepID=A0AAI9E0F4_KLEOX|nr:hypothetical protein [Klebsiella oxytoca]ELM5279783.1 hypothetical protein [Klebsiella oxytoca]MBZ7278753.1 hypothetical protein [Klebsiella oxytoca]MBZ7717240.1 hypothetical protein [Klebsiella oxytoca]MCW9654056.1 hypothetical protein [Klebsiella oxytoca]MDM4107312.1 hypothetical protein [Klebsiella oxytoca]